MARIRQTPGSSGSKGPYRCTACKTQIKTAFEACLHPLLQCLICRRCHTNYGTGDFAAFNDPEVGPGVDEFGDDNYCRWCVDGGDLFACGGGLDDASDPNRCHYAFCADCITRNIPSDPILNVDQLPPDEKASFKWQCFACDPTKLKDLRREAQDAIQVLSQRDLKRGTPNNGNGVSGNSGSTSVIVNSTSESAPSAVKKRRTESTGSAPEQTKSTEKERSKDTDKTAANKTAAKEQDKDRPKESDKTKRKESESAKESEKDRAKDNEKQKAAKDVEKERSKSIEKEVRKEVEKDQGKDAGKDNRKETERAGRSKDTEKEGRSKEIDKERPKEVPEKERPIEKERAREKEKSKEIVKEPEASLMPPLEKPRQTVTSLKRLSTTGATTSSAETRIPKQVNRSISFSTEPPKTHKPPTTSAQNAATSKPSDTVQGSLSDLHLRSKQASDDSSKNLNHNQQQQQQQQQFRPGMAHRPKPLSKQLKQSNEQINPSTKVILTDMELKKKLEIFEKVKDTCITEIGNKFQNVVEMFKAKEMENKAILKYEIEDMDRPLQEFHTMLLDLMSLYNSQT